MQVLARFSRCSPTSTCQTRRIRSRHRLDGSLRGGGGRCDGQATRGGLPHEHNLGRGQGVGMVDEVAEDALQRKHDILTNCPGLPFHAGGGQQVVPATEALQRPNLRAPRTTCSEAARRKAQAKATLEHSSGAPLQPGRDRFIDVHAQQGIFRRSPPALLGLCQRPTQPVALGTH